MDVQDRVRATTDFGDGPGGRRVRRRLYRADQRAVQTPHAAEHRLRLHQSEQRGPDTKLVEWRHVPDAYSFDRIHDEYALYGPGPRERRGRGRARRGARAEPLELHDGGGSRRAARPPGRPSAGRVRYHPPVAGRSPRLVLRDLFCGEPVRSMAMASTDGGLRADDL